MAYYKAVLNGRAFGQEIVNILWYRAIDPSILAFLDPTTGEDLSYQIVQEVWPAMQACLPNDYTLDNVSVYPLTATLQSAFSTPYVRAVSQAGSDTSAVAGVASCMVFRMNVDPLSLVNLLYPMETALLGPRRGYLAIGPLTEGAVDDSGQITSAFMNEARMISFRQALEATLTNAAPPALFVPLRARHKRIAGILTLTGFAKVSSVVTRSRATFRRSRMAEAS